ncbi:colicin Z C-terminal domain-related protein [Stappia sp.]|uniref:colicin Z C-terminal domain-related protein n=1 Tax=Stappia sp. TaxID=1870903 RepID=UPI0032D92015
MDEFHGATVRSTLRACIEKKYPRQPKLGELRIPREMKTRGGTLYALPGRWGPWQTVYEQIAGGPRSLRLEFWSTTETPSTFRVEISGGGGQRFEKLGPGSATIELRENMATHVRMRALSDGVLTQRIRVSVI